MLEGPTHWLLRLKYIILICVIFVYFIVRRNINAADKKMFTLSIKKINENFLYFYNMMMQGSVSLDLKEGHAATNIRFALLIIFSLKRVQ